MVSLTNTQRRSVWKCLFAIRNCFIHAYFAFIVELYIYMYIQSHPILRIFI